MRSSLNWHFFLLGFLVGFVWCLIWIKLLANGGIEILLGKRPPPSFSFSSRRMQEGTGPNRDGPTEWPENMNFTSFKSSSLVEVNNTVAETLAQNVRVVCLVTTSKRYHTTRAIHIKFTWGQRCNKLVFLSDAEDESLGAVAVSTSSDYSSLWGKVKNGFLMTYRLYGKEYDWFLKTDDDTYVVMENFRYFVSGLSADKPIFVGRRLRSATHIGFLSGGAGYAISRKALYLFYSQLQKSQSDPSMCNADGDDGVEDIEIAKCLHAADVKIVDSRDSNNLERFFTFTPRIHVSNDVKYTRLLQDFDFYSPATSDNSSCCGDYSITFHYISPTEMYALDYMINRLRPFGIEKAFFL